MSERIYTRCPACHKDTLTINDDRHLLCTWIYCPDPTLIDRLGEEPEPISTQTESEVKPCAPKSYHTNSDAPAPTVSLPSASNAAVPPSNPAGPAASQHGIDECRHQYTTFTGRCDLCGLTPGDQFDKSHRKQPAERTPEGFTDGPLVMTCVNPPQPPAEAVSDAAREAGLSPVAREVLRICTGRTEGYPDPREPELIDALQRAIIAATAAQQSEIAALRDERDVARWDKEQLWLAIMFGAHGENTQPKEVADAEKVLQELRAELATTRERLVKCEGEQSTEAFLRELKDWQLATFPGETIAGVYEHLQDEVRELGDDLSDQGELADCLMLTMCLCFHQGIDPIAAIRAKHAVNLARKWQKTEAGFRHVKESLAAQPLDGGAL